MVVLRYNEETVRGGNLINIESLSFIVHSGLTIFRIDRGVKETTELKTNRPNPSKSLTMAIIIHVKTKIRQIGTGRLGMFPYIIR